VTAWTDDDDDDDGGWHQLVLQRELAKLTSCKPGHGGTLSACVRDGCAYYCSTSRYTHRTELIRTPHIQSTIFVGAADFASFFYLGAD